MTAAATTHTIPPGYKQTEVGIIPDDWEVKRLGEVAKPVRGGSPRPAGDSRYFNGNFIPWLTVAALTNIPQSQLTVMVTSTCLTEEGARQSRRLEVGTLIIANSGATLGVAKILGLPCCANDGIAALLDLSPTVNPELLVHYINAKTSHLRSVVATGNGQPNLNTDLIARFQIPLPPRAEQEAIAGALSDADIWIESLEKLIAKKRAIKQGAMHALLTPPGQSGHQRLPVFDGKWEVKRLGEIATPSTRKNTSGDDLPVLTCSKHLGFVDSLSYFKNQVFSHDTTGYKVIVRGEIGYPANHVEEGSIGLQDLYDAALVSPIYVVFSVDLSVNPYFLHRLLKLDRYRHVFASATSSSVDRRGSLRWPSFSQIQVAIPNQPEQTAIAAVLSDMDAELEALEAKLSKARQIKQGMMQELLTGRVRLVQSVVPANEKAESRQKTGRNWAINEAVVIAVLARRFGSEQFPLGRKRYTKFSYLLHRHVEHQAVGYRKKAAGPYNPDTKYKGPENIAVKNGYMQRHKRDAYSGFVAADQIAKAEAYFDQWYGVDILAWLEQFRYTKTDDLELLTTVDMAIEDLLAAGRNVSADAVKGVIAGHPEWQAKLDRPLFCDFNLARGIDWSRKLFSGSVGEGTVTVLNGDSP